MDADFLIVATAPASDPRGLWQLRLRIVDGAVTLQTVLVLSLAAETVTVDILPAAEVVQLLERSRAPWAAAAAGQA